MKRNIFKHALAGTILLFATSISSFAADGNFVNITASGKTGLGLAAYDINHALTVWAQSYGPGMGPVYVKTNNSAQNAGSAFTFMGVDAGVRAENVSGNGFSTAIGAFSGLTYNESAAFFAAKQDGTYSAKLSYKDNAGAYWAGCFGGAVKISGTRFTTAWDVARLTLGDASNFIQALKGTGVQIGTNSVPNAVTIQQLSGYVGIGLVPVANKGILQVCGDGRYDGIVYCKELRVQTNAWADYVLKPDYKLKPLSEVEKFIAENQRLPGIPSEQEILKKGVNVGQMQVKMLAKIEEITLHMISLQKENIQLRNRLEKLEKN